MTRTKRLNLRDHQSRWGILAFCAWLLLTLQVLLLLTDASVLQYAALVVTPVLGAAMLYIAFALRRRHQNLNLDRD